jgi:hypothetical protein
MRNWLLSCLVQNTNGIQHALDSHRPLRGRQRYGQLWQFGRPTKTLAGLIGEDLLLYEFSLWMQGRCHGGVSVRAASFPGLWLLRSTLLPVHHDVSCFCTPFPPIPPWQSETSDTSVHGVFSCIDYMLSHKAGFTHFKTLNDTKFLFCHKNETNHQLQKRNWKNITILSKVTRLNNQ